MSSILRNVRPRWRKTVDGVYVRADGVRFKLRNNSGVSMRDGTILFTNLNGIEGFRPDRDSFGFTEYDSRLWCCEHPSS